MIDQTRREFLRHSLCAGAMSMGASRLRAAFAEDAGKPGSKMKFGLVTYLWGKDWDLPTLISNCEQSGVLGVELRTTHKHGVERELTAAQRAQVKKRFDDSPVTNVGIGSAECFDHVSPEALAKAIEATKEFVKLSRDTGGSGVKVRPNTFHKEVPREQTIEQIGKSLNVVGAFGADYGQQIRLEVHGDGSPPPIMKQIIDIADHPNVGLCWNSNGQDLQGEGFEHNFNLLKARFGATCHVRPLNTPGYPWDQLLKLFVERDYPGWLLLEAGGAPADPIAALIEQRRLFEELCAKAQAA
ncbi:MAG: xylose isomerase [Armatimonadetes bacterium CG_4_10_14_3_um_filter_66_18]|nr:TIM barrel protein [Armatimonadota bacterium]OIP12574.1 MAG: xylose isomerase [Armatimonadetes bacterium CG2_30_66_41]PIU89291.1 MAG: xylose isomerase [Armatimonadetes bacterium CG06_land_8_20_14_3_00_66_21]PIX46466.1 MAG: xylose isomerase [Armatimonadetes bacterium CG_4_8_14_3_um_filter_66_20]PIY36121.1 MAG: xylose isomerase [Armatimonadetes bacterium CG_4_10_14_3_um_filter_66_18]PIZ30425.1 MAG: xylose isomerase [Armatimonadetes bacterium CG_4_10_14_0_8_um_filter_66_14]PJB66187.1 MAG: xyl